MKLFLEIFILDNGMPFRHRFHVRDLSVEEFDPKEHWNYKYLWPEAKDFLHDESLVDQVRVWHMVDFSEEERQQLIHMGKIQTVTDMPNITKVIYEGNQ